MILAVACSAMAAQASWYWPFGDEEDDREEPRLSELMEPSSLLIDEASDLASEGKVSEAVEKYRAALKDLDRVEAENPERAKTPEFATLRTKRAYVGAAIDSLLLGQARQNARAVAVSDTTELERRLAEERAGTNAAATVKAPAAKKVAKKAVKKVAKAVRRVKAPRRPLTKKEEAMKAIAEGDFKTADAIIAELLAIRPNDASALNLRAAGETARGRYADAERTLDQAIQSNPRDYFAYYNMAELFLKTNPDNKSGARRYYETGRAIGGPEDAELEAALK